MSEPDVMNELGDGAEAIGRALLARIAPYVRPWERRLELPTMYAVLPLDARFAVGLHPGRPSADMTIGDLDHDTGISLALLEEIADHKQPA